jgi:hypothetical protein
MLQLVEKNAGEVTLPPGQTWSCRRFAVVCLL